ncbi:MAG TPA: 3-hydroxyacyl-CoA dehydrogenase NAD-binding domain-containing protein, partial [Solirubrobacteraceae bacterium]
MGAQIGCEYALAGCTVLWIVRDRQRAEQRVEQALALTLQHELADASAVSQARAAMRWGEPETDAGDELPELIVESLPEHLALKADVLGPLAARHPDAIIASNTSSISLSALGEAAGVAQRIIGTHYWNPPLLMPLVEVLAGEQTPLAQLAQLLGVRRHVRCEATPRLHIGQHREEVLCDRIECLRTAEADR